MEMVTTDKQPTRDFFISRDEVDVVPMTPPLGYIPISEKIYDELLGSKIVSNPIPSDNVLRMMIELDKII